MSDDNNLPIFLNNISRSHKRTIKNQMQRFGRNVTNRFLVRPNENIYSNKGNILNINKNFKPNLDLEKDQDSLEDSEFPDIQNCEEYNFDDRNNIDISYSLDEQDNLENNDNIIENIEDNYSDNEENNFHDSEQFYDDNKENKDFNDKGRPIFNGSNKSVEEFIARFLLIKLKGEVSDNTAEKFLKLFCDFMPDNHNCPRTLNGIRNRLACFIPEVNKVFENTFEHVYENGRLLEFPFMDLIKHTVNRNVKYFLNNHNNSETKILRLLLHTDGAPLSKSSKVQIWPVSAIFLDLPPKIRIAFHNIILFNIWLSNNSEDFSIICNVLKNKLRNKIYSTQYLHKNNEIRFYYKIEIECITGDIPALRKINNLTGHNGSYGCSYCFHKGGYVKTGEGAGNGKMVYNNGTKFDLKTASEYERYAKLLDKNPNQIMFGMIGRSFLEGIVKVPEGLSIDYMHTVLLGPIKEDFIRIRDGDKKVHLNIYKIHKLKENVVNFFDDSLKEFMLPREYKRTIKPLKEFNNYKAIEWKLFMLYGFPTLFLEAIENSVSDFAALQLVLISGIGLLMTDNINEHQLSVSSNLLSMWFEERVKILGVNGMKLKSHIITHLPAIARKFGNITRYSCFAGEGLIQMLGRMISQRTEGNSLNQIKKRFKDFHMASFFIEKEEEQIQNTFINVSNVFTNIFKEKVSTIHEYKFVDKLNFKGFSIRASINGIIDRDNFLIIKEKINNEIIYKPGILLAVGINEKKIICFVKELVTINSLILKDKFKNETLTDSIYNLMNIVDDSGFFKKYFIVDDCYKNLNWVVNNNNIKVIKNEDSIYSKALLIKSKSQVSYICPMLHSFEHN